MTEYRTCHIQQLYRFRGYLACFNIPQETIETLVRGFKLAAFAHQEAYGMQLNSYPFYYLARKIMLHQEKGEELLALPNLPNLPNLPKPDKDKPRTDLDTRWDRMCEIVKQTDDIDARVKLYYTVN